MSDQKNKSQFVDEAMLPAAAFFNEMSNIGGVVSDKMDISRMSISKADLEIPIQMDLKILDNGEVSLGLSPPLLYFETSFMPVFHNLKITLVASENPVQ